MATTTEFLHEKKGSAPQGLVWGTNMAANGGHDVIWSTLYLQLASANGGPNSSPRTENVITKQENKQ